MKRLLMLTVAMSLVAQSTFADDGTDTFFGIDKNKARTQALIGTAETLLAGLWTYQALKRPNYVAAPRNASAAQQMKVAIQNKNFLSRFNAERGGGLIRSMKLVGAAVLFVDVRGRVYEWKSTDAKPSWSPVYSYLMNEEKVPLEQMPESAPAVDPSESMSIPAMDSNDKSLEAELTQKLNSRLARLNDGFRAGVQNELSTVQSRIGQQEQAIASATEQKQQAHSQFSAEQEKRKSDEQFATSTGDFFKARPSNDDSQLAQQVLFGGELLASGLMIKSLFTNEGARAVADAEKSLEKARALVGVDPKDLSVIPHSDKPVARIAAAEALDEVAAQAKLQLEVFKRNPKVDAAELAKLEEQLNSATNGAKALRNGTAVSSKMKAFLLEKAEKNLAQARALATRTSKGAKLLKAVKVVGTTVFVTDAIGRAYQWYTQDANPQFAPGITWALLKAEKPAQQLWDNVSTHVVEPSKAFLQEKYNEIRKGQQSTPPSTPVSTEKAPAPIEVPIFPIGPKL